MNQSIKEIIKEYEEERDKFYRPRTKKAANKAFFSALEKMSTGNIPKHIPDYEWDSHMKILFRGKFGMWALVAEDWVEKLGEYLDDEGIFTVLEIQAGKGWLAKALKKEGVKVIATDDFSWKLNESHVFPVEQMDRLDAMKKYASEVDALVVSWPHFQDYGLVRDLNEAWPADKPIIYIGESMGGCCAPMEFFYHYKNINKKFQDIPIPSWHGINDQVWFGFWDKDAEEPKCGEFDYYIQ